MHRARASISDTILEFARPVLTEIEAPNVENLKRTLEFVITVWNAHVMAMPVWGHPHHLAQLTAASSLRGTPAVSRTFAELSERRLASFTDDERLVSKWDLVEDGSGRTRFDCTAKLPVAPSGPSTPNA